MQTKTFSVCFLEETSRFIFHHRLARCSISNFCASLFMLQNHQWQFSGRELSANRKIVTSSQASLASGECASSEPQKVSVRNAKIYLVVELSAVPMAFNSDTVTELFVGSWFNQLGWPQKAAYTKFLSPSCHHRYVTEFLFNKIRFISRVPTSFLNIFHYLPSCRFIRSAIDTTNRFPRAESAGQIVTLARSEKGEQIRLALTICISLRIV